MIDSLIHAGTAMVAVSSVINAACLQKERNWFRWWIGGMVLYAVGVACIFGGLIAKSFNQ